MKKIKNGLVGLLMAGSLFSPAKANISNEQAVRYVAHIENYIEQKGYEASVEGIKGKKDFLITVDDTLRNNLCNLEPKISVYSTTEDSPLRKCILFYDKHNEQDSIMINDFLNESFVYEKLGDEANIEKQLDKHFDHVLYQQATSTEEKIKPTLPKKVSSRTNIYDFAGRLVKSTNSEMTRRGMKGFTAGNYIMKALDEDKARMMNYLK